jgi:hypothetical protein
MAKPAAAGTAGRRGKADRQGPRTQDRLYPLATQPELVRHRPQRGCDTRNDVLRRDLRSRQMKNACKVMAGTLALTHTPAHPSVSSMAVPAMWISTMSSRSRTPGRREPRNGRPANV